MVPVADQLRSPFVIAALGLYALLVCVPLILLVRCPRRERRLALACMAVVAGLSLYRFRETPPGVMHDTLAIIPVLSQQSTWKWYYVFGERPCALIMGWNALGWYFLWRATSSLLSERILGLLWHVLLVATTITAPVHPLPGSLVAAAMVSAMPTALYLSRNSQGMEVLLQQYLLIVCLLAVRRRSAYRWWAVGAGFLVGALQYTYIAARLVAAYPLLFLAGRERVRRLGWVYVSAAVVALPNLLSWGGMITPGSYLWDAQVGDLQRLLRKTLYVFASLGSSQYAEFGSGAWSYPGAQTLPWPVLGLLIIGVGVGVFSTLGRMLIVAALLGALPNIVSDTNFSWSHRVMMMFLPMTLLISALPAAVSGALQRTGWLGVGSRRVTANWICAVAVAAVALVSGGRVWLSADFWQRWEPKWYFAYHDAVSREFEQLPPNTRLRIWPPDDIAGAAVYAHGWNYHDIDLRPEDIGQMTPLIVVWKNIDAGLLERLQQARASGVVSIEIFAPRITVTRFPSGDQGLLSGINLKT